jgi:hypothetical protein
MTLTDLGKLKLIRLLAEDLSSDEDVAPFERGKTYELFTPYHAFGAAASLAEVFSSAECASVMRGDE